MIKNYHTGSIDTGSGWSWVGLGSSNAVMTTKLNVPSTPAVPAVPEAKKPEQILTGKEAAQADAIARYGREIIQAAAATAGKYLELCLYIRRHSVAQKLVAFELARLGFKRSRISEVNRISQAPDKVFKMYEAKLIGFDKALNMARCEKPGMAPSPTPAALLLEKNHILNADEVASAVAAESAPSGGARSKRSAGSVLKSAAYILATKSTKDKVWTFKEGSYRVTVEKMEVTKPSLGS